MDGILLRLCEKQHPKRVSQSNQKWLDSEIKYIESNPDLLRHLLLGLVENVKISNDENSTLLYCLGLTDQLPEKRMDKSAGTFPDIDCDFQDDRRLEVAQYISKKYGEECVAQIPTFATFKPKGAIRDFTRVQDKPWDLGDQMTKLVPPPLYGKEPKWDQVLNEAPDLLSKPEYQPITLMAKRASGLVRHTGIHAAGLVIAPTDFTNYCPIRTGPNDEHVAQWDMDTLERVGLIKMDLLGISTLRLISKCVQLVKENKGETVDINNLPMNNPNVFKLIRQGDVAGLFQLDQGGGIRDLAVQSQPVSVEDISSILALYRPGPLECGATAEYVARAQGKPIDYLVPELEPILKSTYGVLVYQEQIIRIATDLAGLSLSDADILRKAVGKKKKDLMAQQEDKLIDGMVANGIGRDDATEIWSWIVGFAAYSFNKAHSMAYAFITYYTAYLKLYYPLEFHCALLDNHRDERDKLVEYLSNCRAKDIQVLGPDVNESDVGFAISNDCIRFGLAGIKGIGKVSEAIVQERKDHGPYEDIKSFYKRTRGMRVTKGVIEALAKSSALVSLGAPRSSVMSIVALLSDYDKEKEKYEKKLETYKKRVIKYQEREEERRLAQENKTKVPGKLKEPKKPEEPKKPQIPEIGELSVHEIMDLEKEMLGVYISSHPLYDYKNEILRFTDTHTQSIQDHEPGEFISIIGIISSIKKITTKKGDRMAILILEDLHGFTEVVVFPKTYAQVKPLIKENNVILISGRVESNVPGSTKLIAQKIGELEKKHSKKVNNHKAQIEVDVRNIGKSLDKLTRIVQGDSGTTLTNVVLKLPTGHIKLHNSKPMNEEQLVKLSKVKGVDVKL